jgi:hypothetical protein
MSTLRPPKYKRDIEVEISVNIEAESVGEIPRRMDATVLLGHPRPAMAHIPYGQVFEDTWWFPFRKVMSLGGDRFIVIDDKSSSPALGHVFELYDGDHAFLKPLDAPK